MYAHRLGADLAFYAANSTGGLVSRFTADVQLPRDALVRVLTGIARDAATLACLVAVMFWQDWRLAIVACVLFPAEVVLIVRLGRGLWTAPPGTQARTGALYLRSAPDSAKEIK